VPDLDNFVICTFIAGDPMRGFWFACVPNQLGQHMVPAIAGSKNLDKEQIDDSVVKQMSKDGPLPAVEFNEISNEDWSNFTEKIKKPIHEEQTKILVEQGLDRDTTRGVVSSSSQRESPSTVFGISTPGRPLSDSTSNDDYRVYGRKGGHTFVMDDGDFEEKNKLVRLRTSGGHQIIMNDSEEVLYISNGTGDAWVELTGSGNVHVYGGSSINIRAKENFNLHVDKDINIHAGGNFNVLSKKAFKLEGETISSLSTKETTFYGSDLKLGSSGQINIDPAGAGSFTAGQNLTLVGQLIKLNSGSGPDVEKPEAITVYDLNEAEKDGSGQWQTKEAKLKSITKIAPTHEPWPREAGKPSATSSSASSASNGSGSANSGADGTSGADSNTGTSATPSNKVVTGSDGISVNNAGKPVVSGTNSSSDAGPTEALTQSVRKPADKSYMSRDDNPTPSAGIGPLDATQVKALKTQIALSESGYNYGATEAARGNYLGKYQIGGAVLSDQGYIKPDAYAKYGTAAVNYPSSWTGKDGVTSKDSFLANPTAQEASMDRLLQSNYKTLSKIGAVNSSDDSATVAGMLSTSHLLGAGGAKTWRRTGEGADANNTSGTSYFNMGRYAVNVLAKTS
jgi:mannose-6-phosphate isomerase-like protein (cupin superfamily)